MFRILTLTLSVALVLLLVTTAQAQTWPDDPRPFQRGPGGYLAWYKILLCLLLFLVWVKTTDWVNQDCQKTNLPYSVWTAVVFFPFFVGVFLAMLTLPIFLAGWPLALLCWAVPLGIYVVKRNSAVDPIRRVMTPAHLRFLFAEAGGKVGLKISSERRAAHELGAQVDLRAQGGINYQKDQRNLISARQSPGFLPAKELIASTVDRRAEKAMLDFTQQQLSVKYQIDGVWLDGEPQERETGDLMLAVFKTLCDCNAKERQARQDGMFEATYRDTRHEVGLVSQGTKTGERAILRLINYDVPYKRFEELGAREKLAEQIRQLLRETKGMLLFSSMPNDGLTSTLTVALQESDRYMNDVFGIREESIPEPAVENVEVLTYDASQKETPAKLLPSLLRKQPNVVLLYSLSDSETAKILCRAATEDKLIITAVRAKEAVEALLRVLALGLPASELAPVIKGVVNQRLVRRLCESCKEAYNPNPDMLKKLGIPAGRVKSFFRPPENPEEICEKCAGIGYFGRVATYELLVVSDQLREALVKQPKLDVLRQAARKGGYRTLQEEGLVLVARGITSLSELQRALKQ